ncbi:MAG: hypothetical protein HY928_13085 [Elusimicrobia bacterium]|nr:hypothetical protein [Elusimicrobiota bacterium]
MNRFPILSLIAAGAGALLISTDARAGWGGADKESVTAEDFRQLSRLSGNDKKNWKRIVGLMDETRENERRLEELSRTRQESARRSQARRAAALQDLSGSAGPRASAEVPALPAAGPVAAKKQGRVDEEEERLRKEIQAFVNSRVLTPEIREPVAQYLWTAARHKGGGEVVREHVAYIRQGLAAKGGLLPTIESAPMPDGNTYGLYTSGIRKIELRVGMPWPLFAAVLDHELLHSLDDTRDQRNKGGTPISQNWHRDRGDNIFAGKDAQGGKGEKKEEGAPAAAPAEDGAEKGQQAFDAEFAETLAWRGMACAAEVPAIIPEIQRCD